MKKVNHSYWIFLFLIVLYTDITKSIKTDDDLWEEFKEVYHKKYTTDSEEQRKEIFIRNSKLINDHNKENHSFKLKINQFGDLTLEEFQKYLTEMPFISKNQNYLDETFFTVDELPKAEDLRINGFVTEVKDQGDKFFNSSWAFSVTGAIEGQIFKPTKCCPKIPVENLSELFLIDCLYKNDIKMGIKQAFEFLNSRGIFTEELYNIVKQLNQSCPEENFAIKLSVRFGGVRIKANITQNAIKKELGYYQNTVPAYVDASHQTFQFYHTGIYVEPECKLAKSNLAQAVLIVGYNETDEKARHWLVKNSWGTSWGEEGYMRIAYRTCGIDSQAYKISVEISCCG